MPGERADKLESGQAASTPPEADSASSSAATSIAADAAMALALADLKAGTVIDQKFRIDRILGRGAMGIVAEAMHLELSERVALKFLYANSQTAEEDFRTRFRREAKVSAKLKNEHITRVLDVGVWRDHFPYMVMDLLEGRDLREIIRAQKKLPVALALDYIVQICEGVAEAHAHGIVHRDLKPSNLFVTKRADGSDLVKILDFGISKWTALEGELGELTQTGVVLGSPKYMSPEQLFGSGNVDTRADVWSVGAILYEMLAGRPPYDLPTLTRICAELATDKPPPPLGAVNEEVAPELEAVVMKCFLRTPEERVQNVAELAGAVLDAVGAPFAAQVRGKIASILDPKAARENLGRSSSGMILAASGSYSSNPRVAIAGAGSRPAATSEEDAPPSKRGPWLLVLIAAVLAAGAAAFLFFPTAQPPPLQMPASAAPVASAPTPSASAAATAAAPSTTATASETPSAVATASETPSVVATASAPPKVPALGLRPIATKPVGAATTAEPAPTPPPPPATTQEPPKKKPNPLEDRQ